MKYWRMTFRYGTNGESLWKFCLNRGIAAIGEFNDDGLPLPDLMHMDRKNFENLYDKGPFNGFTGRQSMRHFRYNMEPGDVIYPKEGKQIVGCGIVTSFYQYDSNAMTGTSAEWSHFREVVWDEQFQPIQAVLGADRITLLRLDNAEDASKNRLPALEELLQASGQQLRKPTDEYYVEVMKRASTKG